MPANRLRGPDPDYATIHSSEEDSHEVLNERDGRDEVIGLLTYWIDCRPSQSLDHGKHLGSEEPVPAP